MNLQMNTVRGWLFQAKLDDLRHAYAAARSSCDHDRARLEQQWAAFQAQVDVGTAVLYEEDEDGQIIYDYSEHFGDTNAEIESALSLVRQAFVISLHHLWEREINKFMKTKKYEPKEAYHALEAVGLIVQRDELERLRLACNVAKHSEGRSADELFATNPEMFKLDDAYDKPAYDNLIVTDADLESFFASVVKSGFQRQSTFKAKAP
ncbi:hypothetical protein ACFYE9_11890 [Rhizobium leguminosarum]|uniref:Uncharacterized protein n=2 Tax=Rhizobium leguminosarum TaxID=384 RepID=A0A154IAN0_RHILE|nr:hypothetical protein [Rhizobium leguminosarum]KZA97039.1 hypothetical protein A4A59_33185 [Rhizobium leguminosarum]